MSDVIAQLYAKLGMDTSGFESGMSNAEKAMLGVRTTLGNLDKDIKVSGVNLGSFADAGRALGVSLPISPMAALGQGIKMAGDEMKKAVGDAMEYASQVKTLGSFTGMSSEQTSRLIQTMDDLGISYDTILQASRTMISNGITPSIENLGKLADQYKAIQDPAEQSKFLVDNFGRGAMEMSKAVQLSSGDLKDMYNAISGGLVITQEGAKATEEYRVAIDNWDDTIKGLETTMALKLIPTMTRVTDAGTQLITFSDRASTAIKGQATYIANTSSSWAEYNRRMNEFTSKNMAIIAALGYTNVGVLRLGQSAQDAAKKQADYNATLGLATAFLDKYSPVVKKTVDEVVDAAEAEKQHEQAVKDATRAISLEEMALDNYSRGASDASLQTEKLSKAQKNLYDSLDLQGKELDIISSSFGEFSKSMLYSAAVSGLSQEAALELAKSLGLLDEEAYAAQMQLLNYQQMLKAGLITEQQYLDLVKNLGKELDKKHDPNWSVNLSGTQDGTPHPILEINNDLAKMVTYIGQLHDKSVNVTVNTSYVGNPYDEGTHNGSTGSGNTGGSNNGSGTGTGTGQIGTESAGSYYPPAPGQKGYNAAPASPLRIEIPLYVDGKNLGRAVFDGTLAEAASRGLQLQRVA